jgi:hypothetical protein
LASSANNYFAFGRAGRTSLIAGLVRKLGPPALRTPTHRVGDGVHVCLARHLFQGSGTIHQSDRKTTTTLRHRVQKE